MNKNCFRNTICNRLLAFSLAFALCMGAFAGFSITSHASADAYNQLKAGLEIIKKNDSYDTEDVQYVWFEDHLVNHPYELYCLLEQLTEDEYNQLAKDMEYNALFHYSDDTYKWSDKPKDKKSHLYEVYGTYSECMKYVGEQKKKLEEEEKARQDAISNAISQTDDAIPGLPNNSNNNSNNGNSNNSYQSASDSTSNAEETVNTESSSEAAQATGFPGAHTRLKVGTTFKVIPSGATYRVTKQASYHQLGEVELIKWEGYSTIQGADGDPYHMYYFYGPHMGYASIGVSFRNLSEYIDGVKDANPYSKKDRQKYREWNNSHLGRYENKGTNLSAMMLKMFAPYSIIDNSATVNPDGTKSWETVDEIFVITSIAPGVFKGTDIEYAMIPESVQTIPEGCFQGCKKLEEVWWGSNCLKDLKSDSILSASLPRYNSKKYIKANAFSGCIKLKAFNLTGLYSKISINKNAFKKDKKQIKVNTYNRNKYVKQFAKDIHSKGKSKKATKLKDGVSVCDNTFAPESSDGDVVIKAKKSKKSSKKKK